MLHEFGDRHLPSANYERIVAAFDRDALQRICQMPERRFVRTFGLEKTLVPQKAPSNWYAHRDNGSSILAVAHLDTVVRPNQRQCGFLDTADGTVVYSGALDDRLGAYVLLDLLPKLDINVDILLTVGEEDGRSTAQFYDGGDKQYDWMIEFDRGGTDVVMYQYDDEETRERVEMSGARVGNGIFSDISYMDQLGIKGFNWGVGYQDYHSTRSHAWLDDLFMMVDYFMDFHAMNAGQYMPHEDDGQGWLGWSSWGGGGGFEALPKTMSTELHALEAEYDDGVSAQIKICESQAPSTTWVGLGGEGGR